MYGTQTRVDFPNPMFPFENDVKMYGTQTAATKAKLFGSFENDVKMHGLGKLRVYVK